MDLFILKKSALEYMFCRVISLSIIFKQVVFTFTNLYFGNKYIYTDLLVLVSIIPSFVIIFVIPQFDFNKIGKLGTFYFLAISIFFGAKYYHGYSFIMFTNIIFPVSFLFYFSFKKTAVFSLLIFLQFPIAYLFCNISVAVLNENMVIKKQHRCYISYLQ